MTTVDFSNTLTVEEFTTQLLEAMGEEATMEYAYEQGYVRPSAEYLSYQKPILKRKAALTMARIMDKLTNIKALFTSGNNESFVKGIGNVLNYRIAVYNWNKKKGKDTLLFYIILKFEITV